ERLGADDVSAKGRHDLDFVEADDPLRLFPGVDDKPTPRSRAEPDRARRRLAAEHEALEDLSQGHARIPGVNKNFRGQWLRCTTTRRNAIRCRSTVAGRVLAGSSFVECLESWLAAAFPKGAIRRTYNGVPRENRGPGKTPCSGPRAATAGRWPGQP